MYFRNESVFARETSVHCDGIITGVGRGQPSNCLGRRKTVVRGCERIRKLHGSTKLDFF